MTGDEEFDEAGRDDDVEKASDGEFPVVVGRDGSGNDDGSCIDGRGSEEDDEAPRENLSSKTLSVSLSKLTTTKSLNQSLRMLSFHLLLFFLILSTYFLTLFLNFRGSQCKPVIEKNFVSTSCSRSFSWNLDNSPLVLGRSCNKISSTNEYFNVLHVRSRQHTD